MQKGKIKMTRKQPKRPLKNAFFEMISLQTLVDIDPEDKKVISDFLDKWEMENSK